VIRPSLTPVLAILFAAVAITGCRRATEAPPPPSPPAARNLVFITIDTLRADRVGAYGYGAARTPTMDGVARDGVRFTRAVATAPVTLTSHASLMTGRYPAGHGARHNGMRLDLTTPTLAEALKRAGFSTAAFVAAFPLDRRFGLIKGFEAYGDRMPRGADGRPANERPGRVVVDEAVKWLEGRGDGRFFLWVHLFEPHAPYGDPGGAVQVPVHARYDAEVTEADAQAGRVVRALGPRVLDRDRADTVVVITADHGEAFGEHREIGHSIFVYDTTLRVPLMMAGPGVPKGRTVDGGVSLIDVAPTVLRLLGVAPLDADGIDLGPIMNGGPMPQRDLYAESFAPLLDFGWSPLRAIWSGHWKYIAAPRPELFDLARDPGETRDVARTETQRTAALQAQVTRYSGPDIIDRPNVDQETRARLQALGYTAGSPSPAGAVRPDPKDRRDEAARLAQVISGELQGRALERALRDILQDDPQNPQANLRLGYVLLESGRCREATPYFRSAIAASLPSADAHLGLAACETAERRFDAAAKALREAETVEPGNPVVMANLGLVLSDGGHPADAIAPLQRALTLEPDLHQARFALAVAFARAGRRADAAVTAKELLRRLPPDAPQRPEVERLIGELK
jgi:arylsulfatase A-like enzyme/Tfp pilus assembly protein PilF